jgi:hypothetical protein
MSQRDKLDEIFRAVARQMQDDFQATRRLVRHKGLKGKAAENNLVATFLRATYLRQSPSGKMRRSSAALGTCPPSATS